MKRSLAITCLLGLLTACDGGEHPPGAESCQAIIDACHDVDTGPGEISDCHDTAHDEGTAAACDPIEDRCVMLCEAAASHDDAGAGHDDAGATAHDAGPCAAQGEDCSDLDCCGDLACMSTGGSGGPTVSMCVPAP